MWFLLLAEVEWYMGSSFTSAAAVFYQKEPRTSISGLGSAAKH